MTIPVYNADARRRIRDSVQFTETFGRGGNGTLPRGGSSPAIVAIVKDAIDEDKIGTCYRADAPAFDTGASPVVADTFEVWNPGPAVAANKKVVIEQVSLKGVGTMWAIVAPFAGSSGPVVTVPYLMHTRFYPGTDLVPLVNAGATVTAPGNSFGSGTSIGLGAGGSATFDLNNDLVPAYNLTGIATTTVTVQPTSSATQSNLIATLETLGGAQMVNVTLKIPLNTGSEAFRQYTDQRVIILSSGTPYRAKIQNTSDRQVQVYFDFSFVHYRV